MVNWLLNKHNSKLTAIRRKYSKEFLEEAALVSAFVLKLKDDVQEMASISDATWSSEIVEPFISGQDAALEDELSTELRDKNPSFKPVDLPCVAELLKKQQASSGSGLMSTMAVAGSAGQLERSEFKLLCAQLEFDSNAVDVC